MDIKLTKKEIYIAEECMTLMIGFLSENEHKGHATLKETMNILMKLHDVLPYKELSGRRKR